MTKKKRWAALWTAAALMLALLSGCGGQQGELISLSVCAGGEFVCLDPIYAETSADQTLLMNLYENLMKTVPDGSGGTTVTNGMAKSVNEDENADGTVTYTFKLRSAQWTDGRDVTAEDFVYAWQRLADPASASPYASILSMVSGFDTVRETGDVTQLQVTAKNDSTLEVVVDGQCDWFLTQVCTSPATLPLRQDVIQTWKEGQAAKAAEAAEAGAEETDTQPEYWWSDVTALVTNGPFRTDAPAADGALTVVAFDDYYGSGSGVGELTFHFTGTAEEAWQLYEEDTVDFVWELPQEQIVELAQSETVTHDLAHELETYTLLLNCDQQVFADILVRQALTLSIDRIALAEAAGPTAQAAEGLVPAGVPGDGTEDFRTVAGSQLDNDPEGYDQRCSEARELLQQAGYNSGADLGELEYLYVDEGNAGAVAQALTGMWQDALGVQLSPRAVTQEELEAALDQGTYTLAATDLKAVGNDAECFLMTWTSDSSDNVTGYANSAYDTLMTIIAGAADGEARLGCLHDAEALLLEDSPLAPLYTSVTAWKLREDYTGACRDARGFFLFSAVMVRTA